MMAGMILDYEPRSVECLDKVCVYIISCCYYVLYFVERDEPFATCR